MGAEAGESTLDRRVEKILLVPGSTDETPQVVVKQRSSTGMTLELELSALERIDLELAGENYQLLSITDGSHAGQDGQAALPTFTKLVAIPDRAAVRSLGTSSEITRLSGYRVLPLQSSEIRDGVAKQDDTPFLLDADWYAQPGKTPIEVVVGTPALLRNIRVVPVTFHPVAYDPTTGELEVAHRLSVELDFTGEDLRNVPQDTNKPIPQSFARLVEEQVVGLDRDVEVYNGPGVYAMVCQDDAAVIDAVQPLLEWRRRQGYLVHLVTTTEAGSDPESIRTYLDQLEASSPAPLEFICLVGDANGPVRIATWHETRSGFYGEGDHYYAMLYGTDVVPDTHVGRLSVRSVASLETVVQKIVDYETDPDVSNPEWFTSAGLTGDPSDSGASTVWVQQIVKERLLELGYTRIDTIFSGNFVTQMMASINQGVSIFTYRGFWAMSGMNSGHIEALYNYQQLPFAIVMTCDVGSFEQDVTCRSEAFLRNSHGGAVGAIATATIGTHTRYNNCIFLGVADGVTATGEYRAGPALTCGKLHLYNNYQNNLPHVVEIWSVWNNLMGDPATEIYTGFPEVLMVSHPASVAEGASALPVTVEFGGQPLADAQVSVYKEGETLATGYTNEFGQVAVALGEPTSGEVLVTVSKHNFRPYLGSLIVGDEAVYVNLGAVGFDDGSGGQGVGNGDGLLNAGETIALNITLNNLGSDLAGGVTAVLSSTTPGIEVTSASQSYGDIPGGGSAAGGGAFVFTAASDLVGEYIVDLQLDVTAGGDTWPSLFNYQVYAPRNRVFDTVWGGPGGSMDPGESGTLEVWIVNEGNADMPGATATLSSASQWVTVTDPIGTYGPIPASLNGGNSADPFGIAIDAGCYPGHLAPFTMELDYGDGTSTVVSFSEQVGSAVSTDPVGPDGYGYYAMDDTDTDYLFCPTFEWIEIADDLGGPGTEVELVDNYRWNDDTIQMDLPFWFTFYGEVYDRISICSNGWISMGDTNVRTYRNWAIPCRGGPKNLIAAYWDDIYLPYNNGGVFQWYDEANHRLIIEWSRARNHYNNDNITFQLILWDPAHHYTDTGDGMITFQYLNFISPDHIDGYCSVGIQNETRDDGLLYTYFNDYAGGAAPLQAHRAINIVPVSSSTGERATVSGHVYNAYDNSPLSGVLVSVVGCGRLMFTDEDGFFAGDLPAGNFPVAAAHPSCATDTTGALTFVTGEETVVDFHLNDNLGPAFSNTTVLESTEDAVGPYVVDTAVNDLTGVTGVTLYFTSSASGGPHALPMDVVDPDFGLYHVEIPGQALGSLVQYWLVAGDPVGNVAADPQLAPLEQIYSFVVDEPTVLLDEDLEGVPGWATEGTATAGHWEHCDPIGVEHLGVPVQPEDDHTPNGVMAYITGNNEGGTQGDDDVDGGYHYLYSPMVDLTNYSSARLEYWRWFSNDTGPAPGSDPWLVQVRSSDYGWYPIEYTTHSDHEWVQKSVLLENYIDFYHLFRIMFIIEDQGADSIVEAGVDDIRLTAMAILGDQEPPTVTVTEPNGGEAVMGSSVASWNSTDDVGVVHVEVLLSTDSGASFPDVVASGPYNGSVEWTAPQIHSTTCRLKVRVYDSAQNMVEDVSDADFTIDVDTGVPDVLPTRLSLAHSTPNPFNPATQIGYALPRETAVQLRVYNLEGKLVRTLVNEVQPAGRHTAVWNGRNDQGEQMASGLYFSRLSADGQTFVRKMMLLK